MKQAEEACFAIAQSTGISAEPLPYWKEDSFLIGSWTCQNCFVSLYDRSELVSKLSRIAHLAVSSLHQRRSTMLLSERLAFFIQQILQLCFSKCNSRIIWHQLLIEKADTTTTNVDARATPGILNQNLWEYGLGICILNKRLK